MTIGYLTKVEGPGRWWRVERQYVRVDGSAAVVYDLDRRDLLDPWDRDQRGRRVLEAFTAVPLSSLRARLRRRLAERSRAPIQRTLVADLRELLQFTETFGPLGIGWQSEFAVEVPSIGKAGLRGHTGEGSGWKASFGALGPGRWGVGTVEPFAPHPEWPLERRLRMDSTLHSDGVEDISIEHEDLLALLRLVDAVEQRKGAAEVCRAAMTAVHATEDSPLDVELDRRTDWKQVVKSGSAVKKGKIHPFKPTSPIDFYLFGQLVIANQIDRQLNWATAATIPTPAGRYTKKWEVGSLMEVIYRQLEDQLIHRPGFGVSTCGVCGGALLRTRRTGSVGNRWHTGCGPTGRKRAERERRAEM